MRLNYNPQAFTAELYRVRVMETPTGQLGTTDVGEEDGTTDTVVGDQLDLHRSKQNTVRELPICNTRG